jgi:hypothetical protein
MVALDAIPHLEVVFAQYGQPSLEKLEPAEGMVFCDITPPRDRVDDFIAAGARVLDHHKHARDIVERFGDRGIFADETNEPGVSGALLAYRHIWQTERLVGAERAGLGLPSLSWVVESFATLAGVRDTWQTASPLWERAQDLHAVLMGMPRDYWLAPNGVSRVLDPGQLQLGKMFRDQKAEKVRELCAHGTIRYPSPGGTWAIFPCQAALMSDAAEALRGEGCAVALGWFQLVKDGQVVTVCSLRSDGSVDVGALCKRFGGGGHSRAAGCTLPTSDPLEAVSAIKEGI